MIDITPRARVIPPEPRRSEVPAPQQEQGAADIVDAPRQPAAAAAAQSSPPTSADLPVADKSEPPSSLKKNWRIGEDVLGQERFIKAFFNLLDMVEDDL